MLTRLCASSLPQHEGYLPVCFPQLVVSLAPGHHLLPLSRRKRHMFPPSHQGFGQCHNLQYLVSLLGNILLQVSRDD
jgi:hypothetical protein